MSLAKPLVNEGTPGGAAPWTPDIPEERPPGGAWRPPAAPLPLFPPSRGTAPPRTPRTGERAKVLGDPIRVVFFISFVFFGR